MMKKPPKVNRLYEKPMLISILILLSATIIVSLFYFALPSAYKVNESSDFYNYYLPAAKNLVVGKGLVTDNGQILTRYPPGHSIYLALAILASTMLMVDSYLVIYTLIWLCFGLIAVVIYLVAKQYWEKWFSIIPSIIWMTYIPALWSAKQPNSEIPFILVFLFGVWLYLKMVSIPKPNWSTGLIVGFIIGLSMLIRPIAIFIGVLLFIGIVFFPNSILPTEKLTLAVCFLLGAYLPALFWGVYLKSTTGEFILLSTNGFPAIIDGLTFSASEQGYRQNNLLADRLTAPKNIQTAIMDKNPKTYQAILAILAEETVSNPIGISQLFLFKAARSWYGLDSMRFETYSITYQILYLILITTSVIFSIKRKIIPKHFSILIAFLVIYFWGMTTIALSIVRYMIPVFPLLFIFTPSIFFRSQPAKSEIGHLPIK